MNYIMKYKIYENNLIDHNEYNEYLEIINYHFNDIERSKEELDYYLQTIKKLQEKGGEIYRLIFLVNEKHLNQENLGDHWNITGDFSSFYNSLNDDIPNYYDEDDNEYERKPYIIIANINPEIIDIVGSLEQFIELPNEHEILLTENPTNYKLMTYEQYLKDKGEWRGFIGH